MPESLSDAIDPSEIEFIYCRFVIACLLLSGFTLLSVIIHVALPQEYIFALELLVQF